jgi:hypothetical protein
MGKQGSSSSGGKEGEGEEQGSGHLGVAEDGRVGKRLGWTSGRVKTG